MTTIVYLHGFVSSPASRKAAMLGDFLRRQEPGIDYQVPALDHRPAQAMTQILRLLAGRRPEDVLIVGSSLGGFYATVAAERVRCRAVLVNPAVHPQAHFDRFLGAQQNLYTGERFELTPGHIAELAALDPPELEDGSRYWLLLETGDEVLDYREALARYAGAFRTVVQGGDHSFASFSEFLPAIARWALAGDGAAPAGAAS